MSDEAIITSSTDQIWPRAVSKLASPKPADDPTFLSVMDDGSPKITCERCGAWFVVSLPIDVRAYATMLKAFAKAHKRCKS